MLAWLYGKLSSHVASEDGATAVEYGIMLAFVAAVIIGTVTVLGGKIASSLASFVGKW